MDGDPLDGSQSCAVPQAVVRLDRHPRRFERVLGDGHPGERMSLAGADARSLGLEPALVVGCDGLVEIVPRHVENFEHVGDLCPARFIHDESGFVRAVAQ